MMDAVLRRRLEERHAQSRYRRRRCLASPQGREIDVDGRRVLQFCSNDYLGLANHPALVDAMQQAASAMGVGGGASHLVCGHSELHHQLEQRLAALTGRDRALLFSTGYMANLGAVTALVARAIRLSKTASITPRYSMPVCSAGPAFSDSNTMTSMTWRAA